MIRNGLTSIPYVELIALVPRSKAISAAESPPANPVRPDEATFLTASYAVSPTRALLSCVILLPFQSAVGLSLIKSGIGKATAPPIGMD